MAHIQKRCYACARTVPSSAQACPACGSREAVWRGRCRGLGGVERSKTFERKLDAERWIATQEADKVRGAWVDPALGRITFGAWAESWLKLKVNLKPKTRAGYESILRRHLLPALRDVPLATIRPEDVEQFVAELVAAGAAPMTTRNVYRALSGIMRSAVRNRRIAQNPCTDIALPRPRPREMRPLSAKEVARLAEAAGEAYGPLIYFAAYTGLRWGEIAALRVGRLRLLPGVVDVVESASEVGGAVQFVAPKNGRTRTIRLPRFVGEMLAPRLGDHEALVFPGPDGGPLRHGRFYARVFRPAVAAAGLEEGIRFHDLRHTCAALLIAQSAHPRAIMERLGHSTIAVTMDVYGHLFPSLDEALAAGLDATYRAVAAEPPAATARPQGDLVPITRRETGL
jgi:integrase